MAADSGHVEALKYLIESAHVNKEATTNVSIMIIIDTLMNSESLMIIVHRLERQLWMWQGRTIMWMQLPILKVLRRLGLDFGNKLQEWFVTKG